MMISTQAEKIIRNYWECPNCGESHTLQDAADYGDNAWCDECGEKVTFNGEVELIE